MIKASFRIGKITSQDALLWSQRNKNSQLTSKSYARHYTQQPTTAPPQIIRKLYRILKLEPLLSQACAMTIQLEFKHDYNNVLVVEQSL